FAVMMSLEPAIASLAGFLILSQALTTVQAVAIALVIGASFGAVRTQVGRRPKGAEGEPVASGGK
ncbi:EamA family transporter, partial [Streptomyces albidoflavus]